jgi:hypothetical protein
MAPLKIPRQAEGGNMKADSMPCPVCPHSPQHAQTVCFFGVWLNHVDDMSILGQQQYPVATWTFSISLFGDVNWCLNWI